MKRLNMIFQYINVCQVPRKKIKTSDEEIKHDFSILNVCQVPRKRIKTLDEVIKHDFQYINFCKNIDFSIH